MDQIAALDRSGSSTISPVKVAIIGAGHVGATFAYTLLLSGLAAELVLIDKDHARAQGEAMDLAHALPFNRPASIRAGSYADITGAAICVIAAGPNQHRGETRLDLAARNAVVVRDVASRIVTHNPDGLILVATNPVDVIARLAHEVSGLPACRVIGSGTILDTARFRTLIGAHFGVDPRNVHAQILGEHGDSSVAHWSAAHVAGMALADLARVRGIAFDDGIRQRIEQQTRNAAYAIIAGKGATYYAIASGLVRIVEAILRDQATILTVSNRVGAEQGFPEVDGTWLSLPCIVDRTGIAQVLPVMLDAAERAALARSAEVLRATRERVA